MTVTAGMAALSTVDASPTTVEAAPAVVDAAGPTPGARPGEAAAAVLLVAHGSRDPRAAQATRALARAVAVARPQGPVSVAYLDHAQPPVPHALVRLAATGYRHAVVVPLLLTAAYHGRVDLPVVLARVRAAGLPLRVSLTEVLGAQGLAVDALLIVALRRRLGQLRRPYDALVLAAAGTRDAAARESVAAVATTLGTAAGVRCLPAYAAAAGPTPGEAVRQLRAGGARRVAVASYFLAPGLLYDRAAASAQGGGAVGVAAPLGAAPELAWLVVARVSATARRA
ncbi:MAG TPA: CbiX/SirB N-terminal domain-containing protein [Micromonosporaceae bacterium]|nr:CbiX/SirB N-terminal domain-containing protein [Micromonosporaceae bacterium]